MKSTLSNKSKLLLILTFLPLSSLDVKAAFVSFSDSIANEPYLFSRNDGVGVTLPAFDTSLPSIPADAVLDGVILKILGESTIFYTILNQTGQGINYSLTGDSTIQLFSPYGAPVLLSALTSTSSAIVSTSSGVPKTGSLPTTGDSATIDDSANLSMYVGVGDLFFPMAGFGNGSAAGATPYIVGFTGEASAEVSIEYHYSLGSTTNLPDVGATGVLLSLPLIGMFVLGRKRLSETVHG